MKKIDRRIIRTKKSLQKSILRLLKENSYNSLSIQEISDEANVNRVTFYLHYSSKDDLLVEALEKEFDFFLEEIDKKTREARENLEGKEPDFSMFSSFAFEHVYTYRDLYETLLGKNGPGLVVQHMIDYIAAFTKEQFKKVFEDPDPLELELYTQHIAGSLFAIIRWWVNEGMKQSPEEIAKMCYELWKP